MAAPQAPPWEGRSVQARQVALHAKEGAGQAQARDEPAGQGAAAQHRDAGDGLGPVDQDIGEILARRPDGVADELGVATFRP